MISIIRFFIAFQFHTHVASSFENWLSKLRRFRIKIVKNFLFHQSRRFLLKPPYHSGLHPSPSKEAGSISIFRGPISHSLASPPSLQKPHYLMSLPSNPNQSS